MSDVSGNFNADTVSGTGLLGQPDTLLLTQGVLYAGFLLIITSYGFSCSTTIAQRCRRYKSFDAATE
ncbi:hypothetical protein ACVXG9_12930 [Escherichia coli]